MAAAVFLSPLSDVLLCAPSMGGQDMSKFVISEYWGCLRFAELYTHDS